MVTFITTGMGAVLMEFATYRGDRLIQQSDNKYQFTAVKNVKRPHNKGI